MTLSFYKLDPGQCTCVLGDLCAGSQKVSVQAVGGRGIFLSHHAELREKQFVYSSVQLEGGPSFALSGMVAASSPNGLWIEWSHSDTADAEKVEEAIQEYLRKLGHDPAALAAPWSPPVPEPAAEPSPAAPAAASSADPQAPEKAVPQAPETAAPATTASARAPARRAAAAQATAALPNVKASAAKLAALTGPDGKAPGAESDVGDHIRKMAKKVRSADLASRLETVQVLGIGAIKELIRDSVEERVTLLGQSLREDEKKRLLEEVEEGFKERYEAERASNEEKTRLLQHQLETAQVLLEEERRRVLKASQFTVSDAGMMQLEQRLARVMDGALRKGHVDAHVEDEMRGAVARLLDDERQKIHRQAQEAQNDRISLLEKKVQRLADSLQSAESERDRAQRRAQALETAGFLPFGNVYELGLNEDDPNKEKKLGLLKAIVEINREMRKELAAHGRLPKGGRARPPAPAAADGAAAPGTADAVAKDSAAAPGPSGEAALAAAKSPAAEASPERTAAKPGKPAPASPTAEAARLQPGKPREQAPPLEEQDTDQVEVPVLADGIEVDPDDLPWEPPPEDQGRGSRGVKIKRLGG